MKNPFVGPTPIAEDEKIFGRKSEIGDIYKRLLIDRNLTLFSQSGAGKTSLLKADGGLISKFEDKNFNVLPVVRLSEIVQESLEVNRYVYSLLKSLDSGVVEGLTNKDTLQIAFNKHEPLQNNDKKSHLLIIDQFEELLTSDEFDYPEKKNFLEQLTELYESNKNLWILFVIREDSLPELEKYKPFLPNHAINRYRLELLDRHITCQIIVNTVKKVKKDVKQDALDLLLKDLQGASVRETSATNVDNYQIISPFFLQILCFQLWDISQELTVRAIKSFVKDSDDKQNKPGNITHVALEKYYSLLIHKVSKGHSDQEYELRKWIEKKLIEKKKYRIPVVRAAVSKNDQNILTQLENGKLLVSNPSRYELAHDRLVAVVVESNSNWYGTHLDELQMRIHLYSINQIIAVSGKHLTCEIDKLTEKDSELDGDSQKYLKACEDKRKEELRSKKQKRNKYWYTILIIVAIILAGATGSYFAGKRVKIKPYILQAKAAKAETEKAKAEAAEEKAKAEVAEEKIARAKDQKEIELQDLIIDIRKLKNNKYGYVSDERKMVFAGKSFSLYQEIKKNDTNKGRKYISTVDDNLRYAMSGNAFAHDLKILCDKQEMHPNGRRLICYNKKGPYLDEILLKDQDKKSINIEGANLSNILDFKYINHGQGLLLLFKDKMAKYDLATTKISSFSLPVPNEFTGFTWNRSNILACNTDGTLIILKSDQGKVFVRQDQKWIPIEFGQEATAAAISSDSTSLAFGGAGGMIALYTNNKNGIIKSDVEYPYTSTKDREKLFSIKERIKKSIENQIEKPGEFDTVQSYLKNNKNFRINSLHFVPGDKWLAATHEGGFRIHGGVYSYYGKDHHQIKPLFSVDERCLKSFVIKINPNDSDDTTSIVRNIITSENGTLSYFDLQIDKESTISKVDNRPIRFEGLKSEIIALSAVDSTTESLVLATDSNGVIFIWDLQKLQNEKPYWNYELITGDLIRSVNWKENDENADPGELPTLLVGSPNTKLPVKLITNKSIISQSINEGAITQLEDISGVRDMIYIKKYNVSLFVSIDRTFKIYNYNLKRKGKGREIKPKNRTSYIPHKDGLWAIAYSQKTDLVATGSWDGIVNLWQIKERAKKEISVEFKRSLVIPFYGKSTDNSASQKFRVRTLAFSPNGEQLAVAGKNDHVFLYDVADLENSELSHHTILTKGMGGEVLSVDYNRQSRLAIAGNQGMIEIWSTDKKPKRVLKQMAHKGAIQKVKFSTKDQDPMTFFSAGNDGVIRKWIPDNLDKPKYYAPTEYKLDTYNKDRDEIIFSFALTKNENYLVAGTNKGNLHFWDLNLEKLYKNIEEFVWRKELIDDKKDSYPTTPGQ